MTTGASWAVYAVLSAFFGALVAILGKIGVRDSVITKPDRLTPAADAAGHRGLEL